ncbi:MAG: hypothetical protein VYD57_04450 [Pseudomonadota bacterium]|nr:hypothetical protein [Pseudomonadota bacterium]
MIRRFLCETSRQGLRPVTVGGAHAYQYWDQLTSFLEASLGEPHARLFAEPNVAGSVVIWRAATDIDPVAATSLSEDERNRLIERFETLMGEVSAFAEQLAADKAPDRRRWSDMLKALAERPSQAPLDDLLFAAGDQPVLVQWGTRDEIATESVGALTGVAPRPPRAPSELAAAESPPFRDTGTPATPTGVSPVVQRSSGWLAAGLLWALLALLIGGIYWLLLNACAFGFGGPLTSILGNCPQLEAARPTTPLGAEPSNLQQQLDDLRRLVALSPQCTRVAEAEPAALPQDEAEETDIDRARENAGGQSGDITVTLIWNGRSDLDLEVTCPNGSTVDYRNRRACGGELDIDANQCTNRTNQTGGQVCNAYRNGQPTMTPVENSFFTESEASTGQYGISVSHYATHPDEFGGPKPFRIQVRRGDNVETYQGSVDSGGRVSVAEFTIQ